MEFCAINSISEETIFNVIPFLNLHKFDENSFIFKFGDSSKLFFCILSGMVSIRFPKHENKKNLNNNKGNTMSNINNKNTDSKNGEINLTDLQKKYKEIEDLAKIEQKTLKKHMRIKKVCKKSILFYYLMNFNDFSLIKFLLFVIY